MKTPSIFEKIELATYWFDALGVRLLEDKNLSSMLGKYKTEIETSHRLMNELGVVEICRICATSTPNAGCCGAGIEEWYDEYLLLTNLLLGRSIPTKRLADSDCLFLGTSGCSLMARHDFCINYLCHRIKNKLPQENIDRLTQTSGQELFSYWQIELYLRRLIPKLLSRG